MKKTVIILAVVLFSSFVVYSCGRGSSSAGKEKTELPEGVYYTCTMHPEVHSDKPGNCPKCGMALVRSDEVTATDTSHSGEHEGHEHEGHEH